jgi:hypothetical protein
MPFAAALPFIAQGLGGALKFFGGNSQKGKGQKILDEIGESSDEQVPAEVLKNQKTAELRANTGLPSEQYAQAMRNLQRQQMKAQSRTNDRRGGLMTIAGNQQNYNDAILGLDVANAKARLQNENTLYGINNTVGNWRDKVWRNNVKDKWDRKYQYAMSLLGAGNQNKSNGIDQLIGAGAGLLGGINWGSGGKKYPTGEQFMDRTDFDTFSE